jgi:lipopolysaccharide transport system ATP-binding protein
MSKPIIEVRGLSKKYKIGEKQRYLSLRDSVSNLFSRKNTEGSEFWALDDVSFDIHAGESIGIIGRNGAGKSTLLKILSRITPPTKGSVILRGRMASLLEVGTGFHTELTGRENVFMNGSILGLKKREIEAKFDEIVDFSGVEQFIDTPLKHYSSGMQLRLAFAVAAHLEPEILVIDEVLAVGDAEFQKRCLGKMDEVSRSGRTVIFVSHSLSHVKQLCDRGLLLDKGKCVYEGDILTCLERYSYDEKNENDDYIINFLRESSSYIEVRELLINGLSNSYQHIDVNESKVSISVTFLILKETNLDIEVKIFDEKDMPLAFYSPAQTSGSINFYQKGLHTLEREFMLPPNMNRCKLYFDIALSEPGKKMHAYFPKSCCLTYGGKPTETGAIFDYRKGAGWFYLK